MNKSEAVRKILSDQHQAISSHKPYGVAWAPSNLALCKYWGKRNEELNLPTTSSISVSLEGKGCLTRISINPTEDQYTVNCQPLDPNTAMANRLREFLNLFRREGEYYLVENYTNIPIASGFASSACSFASLVTALNSLYDWQLEPKQLSILARLGSGSACRSIFSGFVEWVQGKRTDGMDSHGVKLDYLWPELRIGMVTVTTERKAVSSREAMSRSVHSSPFYSSWVRQAGIDFEQVKLALSGKDFSLLGEVAENNAIAMHMVMKSSIPTVNYNVTKTNQLISQVQELRSHGIPVFFTQDAGANLHLLFLQQYEAEIIDFFGQMEVLAPFELEQTSNLVLVDTEDREIGFSEKLAAHAMGILHRAFSVVIFRRQGSRIEMLLQQRSANKYHSANLWTNTCCGHPRPQEEVVAAGERRLKEELGVRVTLSKLGSFHYRAHFDSVSLIEDEIDHVLVGICEQEHFVYDPKEVQAYRWVETSWLQQDLTTNPQKYTAWLPQVLAQVQVRLGEIFG